MPNIIINSECNRNCPYCFASKAEKKEMTLSHFKYVLDFLSGSGNSEVRIMGGEPTLHSSFDKIIDCALDRNFNVRVFTNGHISESVLSFLSKRKLSYSFNLNPNDDLAVENLRKLSRRNRCLIGGVLYDENFGFDFLLSSALDCGIKSIMIRPANPVRGAENIFLSEKKMKEMSKEIVKFVLNANENCVRVGFGCGFSENVFSKEQKSILEKCDVINLNWGCRANSGRFDIGPDLEIFRCFPLARWRRANLRDFKNISEAEKYFNTDEFGYCLARDGGTSRY